MDLEDMMPLGMMFAFFLTTALAYIGLGGTMNWIQHDEFLMQGTLLRSAYAGLAGTVSYYVLCMLPE